MAQENISKVAEQVKSETQSVPKASPLPADYPAKPSASKGFREFIPANFKIETPIQEEAIRMAAEWSINAFHGQPSGMCLWSKGYGRGKTTIASAARDALAWTRKPVLMIGEKVYISRIRGTYNKEAEESEYQVMESINGKNLIYDDLGKASIEKQRWGEDIYYDIFDRVEKSGMSLLITMNIDPEEAALRLGGAAWSRMLGICGDRFIDFSNLPDYRLKGLQ
jgi:DNA replication protein DnaC